MNTLKKITLGLFVCGFSGASYGAGQITLDTIDQNFAQLHARYQAMNNAAVAVANDANDANQIIARANGEDIALGTTKNLKKQFARDGNQFQISFTQTISNITDLNNADFSKNKAFFNALSVMEKMKDLPEKKANSADIMESARNALDATMFLTYGFNSLTKNDIGNVIAIRANFGNRLNNLVALYPVAAPAVLPVAGQQFIAAVRGLNVKNPHHANYRPAVPGQPFIAPQDPVAAVPNARLLTVLEPIRKLAKNNVVLAPYFGQFSDLIGGDFARSIQASVARNDTKIVDLTIKTTKNKKKQLLEQTIAELEMKVSKIKKQSK